MKSRVGCWQESIAKLKLELGKVREHNNTLVDGGTMLFGPEATKAKEGGVFIVDTGAGIPPNGLLMVTGQIEEILEVWSVGHKRDCKFNIFLTSYKGGQPARCVGSLWMCSCKNFQDILNAHTTRTPANDSQDKLLENGIRCLYIWQFLVCTLLAIVTDYAL